MLFRPTKLELPECDCHSPTMVSAGGHQRPVLSCRHGLLGYVLPCHGLCSSLPAAGRQDRGLIPKVPMSRKFSTPIRSKLVIAGILCSSSVNSTGFDSSRTWIKKSKQSWKKDPICVKSNFGIPGTIKAFNFRIWDHKTKLSTSIFVSL